MGGACRVSGSVVHLAVGNGRKALQAVTGDVIVGAAVGTFVLANFVGGAVWYTGRSDAETGTAVVLEVVRGDAGLANSDSNGSRVISHAVWNGDVLHASCIGGTAQMFGGSAGQASGRAAVRGAAVDSRGRVGLALSGDGEVVARVANSASVVAGESQAICGDGLLAYGQR